jgi:hypothetical protein
MFPVYIDGNPRSQIEEGSPSRHERDCDYLYIFEKQTFCRATSSRSLTPEPFARRCGMIRLTAYHVQVDCTSAETIDGGSHILGVSTWLNFVENRGRFRGFLCGAQSTGQVGTEI